MQDIVNLEPPAAHSGLPSLVGDGRLDELIGRASGAYDTSDRQPTSMACGVTLSALRTEHDELLAREPELAQAPAELLARAVERARQCSTYPLDPVAVYAVACRERADELARAWYESAVTAFGEHRDAYDWTFGEHLPPELARLRDWWAAGNAYDRDGHPTAERDWDVFEARRARRARHPLRGVTTGLGGVDRALLGLGGLTILGGPPGCGKSALALHTTAAALRGHPDLAALYLLLDPGMTKDRVYERLLCLTAGVDSRALLRPPSDELEKVLRDAGRELSTTVLPRLRVVDVARNRPEDGLDEYEIARYRNELWAATGSDRVLVIVDYLGLVDVPEGVSPTSLDADVHRVGVIQQARSWSRTADHPSGDPYLVIAEVTKGWDGRESLAADHLLGSARLKYAADAVLMLQPGPAPADPAASVPVTLRIVKGRDGVLRSDVPLVFDHTRCRFLEPATPAAPVREGRKPRAGGIDPLAGVGEG